MTFLRMRVVLTSNFLLKTVKISEVIGCQIKGNVDLWRFRAGVTDLRLTRVRGSD
ncbi:hypothetical protein SBDP1_1280031 [Syntrophobacter sp. SbD1]|nr:hypothetical protein SBDP1_1280031 [Syntrophobacter sp. SbD1]